jgi:hypothetical protein
MELRPLLQPRPKPDLIRVIHVQWHIKMHSSLYKHIEFVLCMKIKLITQEEKNGDEMGTLHTAGTWPTPQLSEPTCSIITAFHSQDSGERLSLGTYVAGPQPVSFVRLGQKGRGVWVRVYNLSGSSPSQKGNTDNEAWDSIFHGPYVMLYLCFMREEFSVSENLVNFGTSFFPIYFNTSLVSIYLLFWIWRTSYTTLT